MILQRKTKIEVAINGTGGWDRKRLYALLLGVSLGKRCVFSKYLKDLKVDSGDSSLVLLHSN